MTEQPVRADVVEKLVRAHLDHEPDKVKFALAAVEFADAPTDLEKDWARQRVSGIRRDA